MKIITTLITAVFALSLGACCTKQSSCSMDKKSAKSCCSTGDKAAEKCCAKKK